MSRKSYQRGGPSRLWAYLQLFRAPNLFTAAADVAMGFLFVGGAAGPAALTLLVAASCLLYAAGTTLNDVYDLEADRRLRPHRPLPSGRIDEHWAKRLGYLLLPAAVLAAAAASWAARGEPAARWRPVVVTLALAALIVAYDVRLKRAALAAPVAMGGCRLLNVLLGMSLAERAGPHWPVLGYETHQLMVAAAVGIYVAGLTWFAQSEAVSGARARLAWGVTVVTAGLALLACLPRALPPAEQLALPLDPWVWPVLVLLLYLTIVRRLLAAIADPRPVKKQAAVSLGILSLIVLDASVCLLVSGPVGAVAVVSLLVPALLLGRWAYST